MVSAKKRPKPEVVRRGSVSVKIYTVYNRSRGTRYTQFSLVYRNPDGRRIIRRFSDRDQAVREAELAATRLATGESDATLLAASARNEYARASELVKPLGLSIFGAIEDYSAARSRLPKGVSLAAAVDFFVEKHSSNYPHVTVSEAVERMIASKAKNKRSAVHLKDMDLRLGRFAAAFQKPIRDVTARCVESFLDGLHNSFDPSRQVSARTKRNHLALIGALFRFAARQKLIPKDQADEIATIETAEAESITIQVFSPGELRLLVKTALEMRPSLVPYLTIGAFAGLRSAELQRLDWSHINFESGYLEVTADNAKIRGRRRLVPISDNLREWLRAGSRPAGPVSEFIKIDHQIGLLSRAAKVPWKHNGLRHSFISYRCALTKNVAQVSYEAGNSPAMIHTHYLNMRTEKEAQEWFNIRPM